MRRYLTYIIVISILAIAGIVIYLTMLKTESGTAGESAETKEIKVADEIVYDPELYVCNGLPQLFINTPDNVQIDSKDIYVENARAKMIDTDGEILFSEALKIKGRGNNSWKFPKKPYALKFENEISFLNMNPHKEWVLLALYREPSMMQGNLATYLSKHSSLEYTVELRNIELYINYQYQGTYQIGEKTNLSKGRVLDGNDGYLIEIDFRAKDNSETFFNTNHQKNPLVIKRLKIDGVKEVSENDPNYNYVADFFSTADSVLFSAGWLDPENGYKKYIDIQSVADFYTISELALNTDFSEASTFFTLRSGDNQKIKMGPLWDFELCFNKRIWPDFYDFKFLYLPRNSAWITQMLKDPEFVRLVQARLEDYSKAKGEIKKYLESLVETYRIPAIKNDELWNTLNKTEDFPDSEKAYLNETEIMMSFFFSRLDYLKENFIKLAKKL